MSELLHGIRLEQRFAVLRGIITQEHVRLKEMEEQVIRLFEANQANAISHIIRDKERFERRVKRLEQFISKWETADLEQIDAK